MYGLLEFRTLSLSENSECDIEERHWRLAVVRYIKHSLSKFNKIIVFFIFRDYEEFDIYCPNCGKKGHHVDFSITGEEPQCQCAKYEAFVKYPNRKFNVNVFFFFIVTVSLSEQFSYCTRIKTANYFARE